MERGSKPRNPDSRDPRADADDELIARLASYLVETRGLDEMRRAIAVWQQEAVNAGLPVEQLLVHFKKVLLGMTPAQQARSDVERLRDRRELILTCIQEFYRDRGIT